MVFTENTEISTRYIQNVLIAFQISRKVTELINKLCWNDWLNHLGRKVDKYFQFMVPKTIPD